MDTSERLAAYAVGALAPDETTAIEAALAGDADLRSQLARIRRADEILAELPAVEPSAEFSARLRQNLLAELAEAAPVVDLAARRDSRARRWLAPAAGIAAAAAAVVGIGSMGLFGSSDDAATIAGSDMEAMAPMADGVERGSDMMAMDEAAPFGEPVYTEGGSYDRETLALLGSQSSILDARERASGDPAGSQFAFLDLLSSASGVAERSGAPNAAMADDPAEDGEAADSNPADGTQLTPVNPVAACVPVILDEDRVPLFADLGTFEGAEALIVVLGAPAPDGSFSRLEFWVLDPGTCDVLHFAQR